MSGHAVTPLWGLLFACTFCLMTTDAMAQSRGQGDGETPTLSERVEDLQERVVRGTSLLEQRLERYNRALLASKTKKSAGTERKRAIKLAETLGEDLDRMRSAYKQSKNPAVARQIQALKSKLGGLTKALKGNAQVNMPEGFGEAVAQLPSP